MASAAHEALLGLLSWRAGLGETFATAALAALARDDALRRTMMTLFERELDMSLDEVAAIRAEVDHREFGRTDLEGQTANGRPVLVVEAKLEAGLGDEQIRRYLDLQRTEVQDLATGLVLLVPAPRIEQVKRQAHRAARSSDDRRRLGVVSWTQLLDELDRTAASLPQGPESFSSDISQLRALVDARTRERVPVLAEAVAGPGWASRQAELSELVDFVTARVAQSVGCKRGPLVSGDATFSPARYLRARGPVPDTYFAVGLQGTFAAEGATPLWVRFHKVTGRRRALREIRSRLQASRFGSTWRSDGGHAWIPIPLDPDLADEALVESCVRRVLDVLAELGAENRDMHDESSVVSSGEPNES